MKKGKLLIGCCGAIGASNLEIYTHLLQEFFEIDVILTANARHFVKTESLKFSVKGIYTDLFRLDDFVPHILLTQKIDYFLILPATANFIGRMANGIADDLLSTSVVAYQGRLLICPNMNQRMWENSIVKENVEKIKKRGHLFLNEQKRSYEVATRKNIDIDAGLPDPKRLLEILLDKI